MKNSRVKQGIKTYLDKKEQARVEDLYQSLGYSKSIIHRYLNELATEEEIRKYGKPPVVFYRLSDSAKPSTSIEFNITPKESRLINDNYLYTDPSGNLLYGVEGFLQWAYNTRQGNNPKLAREYAQTRQEANSYMGNNGYVDAIRRIREIFPDTILRGVFYSDFYSLPKFGKTKLGQLVLHGKQSQQRSLVRIVAKEIASTVYKIVEEYDIDCVSYLPHSIPREVQFLDELEVALMVQRPSINIFKAFQGDIVVAQKTLGSLQERKHNAHDTIFIGDTQHKFENVLLIDDAIGSGASVDETAKKLIKLGIAKNVYAYAVVGSYKGFEVIPAV